MMTKYWQIGAQTVYMPAVGCFMNVMMHKGIYGKRTAPSNHILPLPLRTFYSSHSSLCTLCVLQRDVSTFNLSQVHHQIFMQVLRRDARYTFYEGLFVVFSQECITGFWSLNHWRESSIQKMTKQHVYNLYKSTLWYHTCWLQLRLWHNSQQLFSLKYLFVNLICELLLTSVPSLTLYQWGKFAFGSYLSLMKNEGQNWRR